MLNQKRRFALLFSICFISAVFSACVKQQEQRVPESSPPPISTEAENTEPKGAPQLPRPQANEVAEAVKRVFKDAMTMRPGEASFMAGDYNGDLSQDIAVIVTPAPSLLSELNQEYPSFILRDPLTEASPASVVRAKTEPPQRMSIAADDVLLAIIHGFGPNGWRDPEATQTYLLKNVVGQNMSTESLKSLKDRLNGKPAPKIAGDVISERIGAAEGFIYYSGAYYRWYDPRSYKAEKPRVEVHSGARQ